MDPSTGKLSPMYATRSAAGVAISPDSSRVAYLTDYGITIARVVVNGSGPALVEEKQFAQTRDIMSQWTLRWTPDGRRLSFDDGYIDPDQEIVYRCPDIDFLRVRYATLIPGSHDVVCETDYTLRRDDQIITSGAFGFPTSDGQLLQNGTVVAHGAQPEPPVGVGAGTVPALPEGSFANFPSGVHGEYVVAEAAGFVTLYRVEENLGEPAAGSIIYTGVEDSGASAGSASEAWPLAEALMPWFTDGVGRRYAHLGTSPDGEEAFYGIVSYVIESDSLTNVLRTISVEGALVGVRRDGTSRGFRTSTLGRGTIAGGGLPDPGERLNHIPPHLMPGLVISFKNGDTLVPIDIDINGRPDSWIGWRDGDPWLGDRIGMMSPDGRDFATVIGDGTTEPRKLCVSRISEGLRTECLDVPYDFTHARVLGIVGADTDARYADDAPRILHTSRAAAYPGATVEISGVRFGESGELFIGDMAVPQSAIVEWSDRRVAFVMDASMPLAGPLMVRTDAGDTAAQREFWLHRTRQVQTPFDDVPIGRIELGQGLNALDLGSLTEFEFQTEGGHRRWVFSQEMYDDEGDFYAFAEGSATVYQDSARLVAGDYSREIYFEHGTGLSDDSRWQPVALQYRQPGQQTIIARELGELRALGPNGRFMVPQDERVLLVEPSTQDRWSFSCPVEDGSGIWRVRENRGYPSRLLRQTGWNRIEQPPEMRAVYAQEVTSLPIGMSAVEQAGDIMIATGSVDGVGAYAMSTDRGATFGEPVVVPTVEGKLREPIRVQASSGTFFLVFSSPANAPGLTGVYAVTLEGTFVELVGDLPNGRLGGGLAPDVLPLTYAERDGEVLVYFPQTKVLVRADLSGFSPTGNTISWEVVPSAAAEEQVASVHYDEDSETFYALLDDGTVMSASDDWGVWSVEDLGIDLALPTQVAPSGLGRMSDGRWLIQASLFDARAGVAPQTPSPLRQEAFLVSPR
ncbi:hypothetical protein FRC98_07065 [Lujinxingia vulgaris]|uniref:IPT/TIG domain-containing protein n=1 Tax=Lujinxingia vulgaris TaxID=2600176 RepID=A0A5C6XAG3_9DELT|nr:hypothetical protein [Lujinxingia vulgaris]TXD37450.1 hypothetical protein FRC98_07065 [Lujinxingia vulgaris]